MTHFVYSQHRVALAEGEVYRNPRMFSVPEAAATSVRIVGDWPKIAAAYRKAGVEVVTDAPPAADMPPGTFLCGSDDEIPVIPENYRDLAWPELRVLARQCGARWAINRTQAFAAIEAYLSPETPFVPSP